MIEQAVIVHLPLVEAPLGSAREREVVTNLTDALDRAIDAHGVGQFDGEELGDGRCVIYMYGPDADQLFAIVEPVLKAEPLVRGGFAIKRYGEAKDVGAAEVRINL
jgi:hypothetical protein